MSNPYGILLDEGEPIPREGLDIDRYVRYMKGTGHKGHGERPKVKGRKCCMWCGGYVPPPKRSFCSDACVASWRLRTGGTLLRGAVDARDKGVCAVCGLDTRRLTLMIYPDYYELQFQFTQERFGKRFVHNLTQEEREAWNREAARIKHQVVRLRSRIDSIWLRDGSLKTTLWEADHIVPVIEGGGCCGVDNMQTLCLRCHYAKPRTRKSNDVPRKAKVRKRRKAPLND